jgi:hypothetical protein
MLLLQFPGEEKVDSDLSEIFTYSSIFKLLAKKKR